MAGVAPVWPFALLSPARSEILSSCVSAATSRPARLSALSDGSHQGRPPGAEHGPLAAPAVDAQHSMAAVTASMARRGRQLLGLIVLRASRLGDGPMLHATSPSA